MTNNEVIEVLEKEESYMLSHGGDRQAKALRIAIDKIEQEPCEDAVSRKAVRDTIFAECAGTKLDIDFVKVLLLQRAIKTLPSVTPQEPRKGHWEVASDGYGDNAYICCCSECKDTVWVYKDADRRWNYCPNCGADMREGQA